MIKRMNRIWIGLLALVMVGIIIIVSANAAVSYDNSADGNATFEGYDSSDVANNEYNLTIGFNTSNDTASLVWQINISNPGSLNYEWVDLDIWNGTDWVNAGNLNNSTFIANSSNIANTSGWTYK